MGFPPFLPNVPIEPDGELMPERGGLAVDQRRGGILAALGRGANRVAGGINTVRQHPLYEMLWKGAVSGMAGDPRAGQKALDQMRQGPSLQDTLAQLRIRDYENRLADSQAKKDAEKAKQEKLAKLSEFIRVGDIENARALAAELEPQSAAGELFRAPSRPSPKAILDQKTGQPIFVDAPDAIGKQPYYKPGLRGEITLPDGTRVALGDGVGTPSQIHDDIAQEASLDTTLSMLGDAMKTIRENRGATGIGGVVGKPLSGLAGGLEDVGVLPPGSGADVAKAITGSSQETLQQLTTIKEALVPALRPWMADKGPLSIQERTALQNAVGIMSATTNSRQADAALKQIVTTILGNQIRTQRGLGRPNRLDPTINDQSALALAKSLRDMGFGDAEIDRFAESLGYGR